MTYHSTSRLVSTPPWGFSLVETLVAISILLLVVVGPLTISSRTAKSSTFASEQLTAQLLAQEGLELAEKARTDYILESYRDNVTGIWANFASVSSANYGQCFNAAQGCGLSVDTNGEVTLQVVACNTAATPNPCSLYTGAVGTRARYTHTDTGTLSPYTRIVRFYTTGNVNQMRVESIVTWRTGSLIANQRVEVETFLFNVYGR